MIGGCFRSCPTNRAFYAFLFYIISDNFQNKKFLTDFMSVLSSLSLSNINNDNNKIIDSTNN